MLPMLTMPAPQQREALAVAAGPMDRRVEEAGELEAGERGQLLRARAHHLVAPGCIAQDPPLADRAALLGSR